MEDQKVRLISKKGNGVPTIPPSNDHRNGDWIATDIYEGEQYLDLDTGIEYTRVGDEIMQYGTGAHKIYKAIFSQSGTSAPSVTYLINNTVGTVNITRQSAGTYRITTEGLWTASRCFINHPKISDVNHSIVIKRTNTNYISILTYDSGTLSDGILDETNINIEVY